MGGGCRTTRLAHIRLSLAEVIHCNNSDTAWNAVFFFFFLARMVVGLWCFAGGEGDGEGSRHDSTAAKWLDSFGVGAG